MDALHGHSLHALTVTLSTLSRSYNGTGLLVVVRSECLGAVAVNSTVGRRLVIGDTKLNIATYLRFKDLAAAQATEAAYQSDFNR